MTLKGRTALITGAYGGIGSAVARAFAAAGADISLADVVSGASLADEIKAQHRRVISAVVDVTKPEQVKTLVRTTAEALGISEATVKREWTLARAWLRRELGKSF